MPAFASGRNKEGEWTRLQPREEAVFTVLGQGRHETSRADVKPRRQCLRRDRNLNCAATDGGIRELMADFQPSPVADVAPVRVAITRPARDWRLQGERVTHVA